MVIGQLTLVILGAFALTLVKADVGDDVNKAVDDVTSTEQGSKWCPAILVGTQCPDSSVFHYYSCCGDLLRECCFNMQVWVIVVLAVIGVIIVASVVLSLIRCLFCRK